MPTKNSTRPAPRPLKQDKLVWADALRIQMELMENLAWTRNRGVIEQMYLIAKGALRIGEEQQGLANLGDPAATAATGPVANTTKVLPRAGSRPSVVSGASRAARLKHPGA